jgi:hypothetical protein
MEYTVNGIPIGYEAKGERHWGSDEILIENAVDISASTSWRKVGFTIEPLFDNNTYESFSTNVSELLLTLWGEAGLKIPLKFDLTQYHTVIPDFKTHLAVVEKTKLLSVNRFPIEADILVDRISSLCGAPLIAKNPFDGERVFHLRVIRPNSHDNNPLHRDVWLEDYDDCINLYIPVAGSNERSSLIIVPESHRWPESRIERTGEGAEINGIKFNVPAITAIQGLYAVERPNPGKNEVLIFSPYLIHGGSVNLNNDQTRISIEMRLWKK